VFLLLSTSKGETEEESSHYERLGEECSLRKGTTLEVLMTESQLEGEREEYEVSV
jgi:hypothetical protein